MSNVFSLNNVKKAAALVLMILLVAALLPAPVQAAEAKWVQGTPGSADSRTKIGDGYFWTSYNDEYTHRTLYYSASKTGKAVKLATMDMSKYHFGSTILFNGSKVYYTTYNWEANYREYVDDTKIRIHSVSKNGEGNKVIKSMKVKDMSPIPKLLSVYNGRIYFLRYSDVESKLSSMNMKKNSDGKYIVLTHKSDIWKAEASGNTRYIYYRTADARYAEPGLSENIKVYDVKGKEVVRTLKNVKNFACTNNYTYYYQYDSDKGTSALYRAGVDGKDKKTVIMKFNSTTCYGGHTTSKLYYYVRGEQDSTFYEYNISKGTKKEISESTFISKAFGGTMGM